MTGRILGDESFYDAKRGAAGWKPYFVGGETPPLSALVVDRGRGWPALSPPAARGARPPRGPRPPRRLGRRPARPRHRAGERRCSLASDVSDPLAADRPPHESRERQLLRRDAAQAAPAADGEGRDVGSRRTARDRGDARGGHPRRGRPHRRRLGALEPRPPDGRGARRRAPRRRDRPCDRERVRRLARRRRCQRHAEHAAAGAPRPGDGQDGHDRPRLHALGPDRRRGRASRCSRTADPVSSWAARARPRTGSSRLASAYAGSGARLPSRACRSASPRIGTPAFSAFAAFEPGLSPTITPVVFFETESETLAPSASSAAFACSRLNALERAGDHVLAGP